MTNEPGGAALAAAGGGAVRRAEWAELQAGGGGLAGEQSTVRVRATTRLAERTGRCEPRRMRSQASQEVAMSMASRWSSEAPAGSWADSGPSTCFRFSSSMCRLTATTAATAADVEARRATARRTGEISS